MILRHKRIEPHAVQKGKFVAIMRPMLVNTSVLTQTVEKFSFQQDIALNQLPKAHKSAAAPVAAMLQYLAENGVKSAKNFIAAPPW